MVSIDNCVCVHRVWIVRSILAVDIAELMSGGLFRVDEQLRHWHVSFC